MIHALKKLSHLQKIDTQSLFLSSIISFRLVGGRYQAHARREGIEYLGVRPHSDVKDAIEEGRLVASEWFCYEQFAACVIGDFLSGKLVAINEKAIALLNQKKGDRFVVFKSRDKNCLLTKNRLTEMDIEDELETSYQGINLIAKKLTENLFIVFFLEEYYLD